MELGNAAVLRAQNSIDGDEIPSSIQRNDLELEAFGLALTAAVWRKESQPGDFHASPLWRAVQASREAKQKPPHFEMPMNMARWLRKNRNEGPRNAIAAAEERKQRALASVVRSIPEGLTIHTRRQHRTSPLGKHVPRCGEEAQGSATRHDMRKGNGFAGGLPRATRAHHELDGVHPEPNTSSRTCTAPLTSPSPSPTASALAPPSLPVAHQPLPLRSPAKVIVTPRTLHYVSSLPKPETYADGIRLVATILESHHRHKNALNDLEVEKHSIAYRTAARMRVLWTDARVQRYEHMLAFLRLCARVHASEHRGLDDVRIVQLYDGFEICCRWCGAGDSAGGAAGVYSPSTASDDVPPLEQQDEVLQGYLSLAAQEPSASTMDISFEQYLTCLLKDTPSSSAAMVAAQHAFRRFSQRSRSSTLRADCYKQLCNEFSLVPSPIFRSPEQAISGATFSEMMMRQLPNGRLLDRAIARLVKLGVIPPPPWVRDWFAQYSDAGDDAHTVSGGSVGMSSGGKKWARLAHAVRGAVGSDGAQGREPAKLSRTTQAIGVGGNGDSAAAMHGQQQSPKLRGMTWYGGPGTPSTIDDSPARAPAVSVERMTVLLRDKGGARFSDAAAAAAAVVTKYDVDVDSVLNEAEFVCAFVDDATLHGLGRW